MSLSTADCDSSVLTVHFTFEDKVVAVLRIAQAAGAFHRKCEGIPQYIDRDSSVNIDYISDKEEIDQFSPIQVYCGNNPSLPSILLMEETEYDLELVSFDSGITNELQYLFDNDQTLSLKVNRFGNGRTHKIYTFYSKSYVGKGFFDITLRGNVLKIPFEVRSKKIEYLRDYPQMLEDIAGFSSAVLLDPGSPLYRNYAATYKSKTTLYEDFLVLDYLFGKCEFESVYGYVRNNRYSELKADSEENVTGSVSSMDPSLLVDLLASDNLIPCEGGVIDGRFTPAVLHETVFADTFDVPENRVIKDLLQTIQSMIYAIGDSVLVEKSGYVKDRISEMKRIVDGFIADSWLAEVS